MDGESEKNNPSVLAFEKREEKHNTVTKPYHYEFRLNKIKCQKFKDIQKGEEGQLLKIKLKPPQGNNQIKPQATTWMALVKPKQPP